MTSVNVKILENNGLDCKECMKIRDKLHNHVIQKHMKEIKRELRAMGIK